MVTKVMKRFDVILIYEQIKEIIERYGFVSLADILDLMEEPSSYKDSTIGWTDISDIEMQLTDDNIMLDDMPDYYIGSGKSFLKLSEPKKLY